MGVKPPDYIDPPKYSYTAHTVLHAYNMIARSRRYEQGTPLALGIADIESYLELHDSPVELYVFVECVLMLDNLFLDQAYKKK
ncbi:hypothetical protein G0028_07725 [Acinetobacter piscicola]|uniref:Uncharacterized protein n=2 Tax=Moraxellaceae TaxID=468 RepID=A0A7S6VZU5_9GAMM|nr:hypothetical protein G0028_07725 [Acinetobacter piscicola]